MNSVDLPSVRHAYGSFGGKAGSHVLALLRELRMPIVSTLQPRGLVARRAESRHSSTPRFKFLDRLARCEGFDWDDGNAPKVRQRHDSEPGECEQAFISEPLLVFADPAYSQHEERWRALGATLAGRRVYLVFTIRRGVLIRVLAVRDMNCKERRTYEHAKARFEEDPDVQV